ncbi:MAG: hypothetical protein WCV93_05180 [Candidatus Shapirobacteria bacterium]|jgi:RNA polymerase-interacting CarD/CdnL/TRCF family regulator
MNQEYSVGDYIIDSSCIHLITAIKKQKSGDEEETYVFYEPVVGSDKRYTSSIPIKNLTKSGTRKVLTAKQAEELMKSLKVKETTEIEYDSMTAKEDVYRNEPERTVRVLKYFWKNSSTLNKIDSSLMWEILENLCKEVSFVTKKKVLAVKEEMVETLNKHVSI